MSEAFRPAHYGTNAARIIRDEPTMRTAVTEATRSKDERRQAAWAEIDADAWRDWARDLKTHVLTHLADYLEEAEDRLIENGVHVHWAETAEDACRTVTRIADGRGVRRVVKAKSMLTEEVGLNAHLEAGGLEVRETDLGEFIIQLLDEPPSHIVGPSLHRSLDDCRRLFHERFGTPPDATPETLAATARRVLRDDFLRADMGVSGANFLAADTGTLALIENEGNIRISTSVPPVHVALVGIEKLVPTFEDLSGMIQLTARSATGQPIGNYTSLIQGPRRPGERDGPEEVHVVLVDNGRSRLLADDHAWETLRCVRCGSCLNICPVYRQTGGHAYGWAYSGPIGAILAPGLLGLEESMPLPYASSLCGACAEVCPVRIPIPELLVYWRERAAEEGLAPRTETAAMKAWATLAEHPGAFGAAAEAIRVLPRGKAGRALPVLRGWVEERAAPEPSGERFLDTWNRREDR
ncbi:MAG: LutB/LldF family L-lactate oxidation iron-sulfur protein [Gemmatimonadota bacterium]|nr:LutB/LldF family L-lactate oxidation iron-sulfur protein [Gemmatimonadota bacterium]